MKTIQELLKLGESGQHVLLQNVTNAEFVAFCNTHITDKKLYYLTIFGNVRGYKITDFSLLARLPRLKEVYLSHFITQQQLKQICALGQLEALHLSHAGKLITLDPLQHLTKLKELTVTTPTGWITKQLHIPSVHPLSCLKKLEYLNLGGIAIDADGLEPLRQLSHLKTLTIAKKYWPEARALQVQIPQLKTNEWL